MLNIYYKIEFGTIPEKSIINWEITLGDIIAIAVSAIALFVAYRFAKKQINQNNILYSMQIFSQFQFEFQRQWFDFLHNNYSEDEKNTIVVDIFSNLETLAKSYNHDQIVDPFRVDAEHYISSSLKLLLSNDYFKNIFDKSRSENDTYRELMIFYKNINQ